VSAVEMAWQGEKDHLVCQWSDVGKRVPYNPPWMQDAPEDVYRKTVPPPVLDFTRVSPFGGSEWYAPRSGMTRSGSSR
jgi:hypothetical protein